MICFETANVEWYEFQQKSFFMLQTSEGLDIGPWFQKSYTKSFVSY